MAYSYNYGGFDPNTPIGSKKKPQAMFSFDYLPNHGSERRRRAVLEDVTPNGSGPGTSRKRMNSSPRSVDGKKSRKVVRKLVKKQEKKRKSDAENDVKLRQVPVVRIKRIDQESASTSDEDESSPDIPDEDQDQALMASDEDEGSSPDIPEIDQESSDEDEMSFPDLSDEDQASSEEDERSFPDVHHEDQNQSISTDLIYEGQRSSPDIPDEEEGQQPSPDISDEEEDQRSTLAINIKDEDQGSSTDVINEDQDSTMDIPVHTPVPTPVVATECVEQRHSDGDDYVEFILNQDELQYRELRNHNITRNRTSVKLNATQIQTGFLTTNEFSTLMPFQEAPGVCMYTKPLPTPPGLGVGYLKIEARTARPVDTFPNCSGVFWVLSGNVMFRHAGSHYASQERRRNYLKGELFSAGSMIMIPQNAVFTFENPGDDEVLLGYNLVSLSNGNS